MDYKIISMNETTIIGTEIKTNNLKANETIPGQWQAFFTENIIEQIPGKVMPVKIFGLYIDYESDENGDYNFVTGCPSEKISNIPENMVYKTLPASKYAVFTAESKEKVIEAWQRVWQSKLERTYTGDFEIYDLSSQEVLVYVAIK